jgi:small subunit ribosomal protein S9
VTEHSEDDPRTEPTEPPSEPTEPSSADEQPSAESESAAESQPVDAEPAADTPRAAADAAAEAPADEDELTGQPAAAAETPEPAPEPGPATPPEALPATPSAEATEPLQAEPAAAPDAADAAAPDAAAPDAAAPDAAAPDAAAEGGAADEVAEDDEELVPRQKPEIPGADLIPDIVPEGEQFLDAEAQAAAEAEAEAAAARAREESDDAATPIADATIDLAAGARYTATGKRKTAVARVVLKPGTGTYSINGRELNGFFPREPLQRMIRQPLETVGYDARMDVIARMHGGGVAAQAGALRHGISRALIVADPNLRGELKRRGFLTRDPRVKERKKAGLKKARKRPQFSKR